MKRTVKKEYSIIDRNIYMKDVLTGQTHIIHNGEIVDILNNYENKLDKPKVIPKPTTSK